MYTGTYYWRKNKGGRRPKPRGQGRKKVNEKANREGREKQLNVNTVKSYGAKNEVDTQIAGKYKATSKRQYKEDKIGA